jgi:hypothetical protein
MGKAWRFMRRDGSIVIVEITLDTQQHGRRFGTH